MYKKFSLSCAQLSAIFLLLISFLSCDKEAVNEDSPGKHIAESEKLTIPATVELPSNAPAGNSRVTTFYAIGVQQYKSQIKPGSMPEMYEWIFVAPQADLYDMSNKKVGTHSAGPVWQLSPGDSIYGQAFAPARTAPAPDASSIDWLLLMPKTGKNPTGVFANVAYIQRIATRGGKAPVTPPQHAGQTINVPYTAVYRFSRKNE
jgi:hypothetical protein